MPVSDSYGLIFERNVFSKLAKGKTRASAALILPMFCLRLWNIGFAAEKKIKEEVVNYEMLLLSL